MPGRVQSDGVRSELVVMPWTARRSLRLLAVSTAFLLPSAYHARIGQRSMQPMQAATVASVKRLESPRIIDTARGPESIDSLYRAADRRLIWFHGTHPSLAARAALAALRAAPDDGLRANDYGVATLDSLMRAQETTPFDSLQREQFDHRVSASLLAFLEDLRFGRTAAAPPRVIAARDSARVTTFDTMAAAADGESVTTLALDARPHVREYRDLRDALARYRVLAADTSLTTVPTPHDLPVRAGDPRPGAAALRHRLVALGDLSPTATRDSAPKYDSTLVDAVRHFQTRHGLAADGVIGQETLDALETPLGRRVTQIELAMERVRRQPRPDSGRLIVVDVPAFELFAFDSVTDRATPSLELKVIVGRTGRNETPSIDEELRSLDFWPYWNVPRSILTDEILPHLRNDSLYLRSQNMEVVGEDDTPLGDSVTTSLLSGLENGAYRVRQKPGPGNALGLVKFVIPNDSAIYLHDTPDKSLFAPPRRDFSHGCIRVERPRELAAWVLREQTDWNADSLDLALAGPESRSITLARAIPVIVEYNTAMVGADGTISFLPDIYGRDLALAEALGMRNR